MSEARGKRILGKDAFVMSEPLVATDEIDPLMIEVNKFHAMSPEKMNTIKSGTD